jgi:hypothetical protein
MLPLASRPALQQQLEGAAPPFLAGNEERGSAVVLGQVDVAPGEDELTEHGDVTTARGGEHGGTAAARALVHVGAGGEKHGTHVGVAIARGAVEGAVLEGAVDGVAVGPAVELAQDPGGVTLVREGDHGGGGGVVGHVSGVVATGREERHWLRCNDALVQLLSEYLAYGFSDSPARVARSLHDLT